MWNSKRFCVIWRNGGNWAAFFIFWFLASAIISALEHSDQNKVLTEEQENKRDLSYLTSIFKKKKEFVFQNDTILANQLEKVIDIMEGSPDMARLWGKVDGEMALVKHKMIKTIVELVKDEFFRIKLELDKEDKRGRDLADRFIKLLSEDDTVAVFRKSGEYHMMEIVKETEEREERCSERKEKGLSCEENWSFGNSLHFTSTVFTSTGYGAKTPITTGGKIATIILIIIQIPFFLHCLATTATHLNLSLDIILGNYSKDYDMEDLTTETVNIRQKKLIILKGLVILASVLFVHMAAAAVYHFCTTGWSFSTVLYFEFVRTASVGFGDHIPEDEYTFVGAIFKNLLVNIPSQIVTFAMFVRVLPVLS